MSAFRRAVRSGWAVIEMKHGMGQNHKYGSSEIDTHRKRLEWCAENILSGKYLASISNVKFRYAFKNHSDATMFSLAWV